MSRRAPAITVTTQGRPPLSGLAGVAVMLAEMHNRPPALELVASAPGGDGVSSPAHERDPQGSPVPAVL